MITDFFYFPLFRHLTRKLSCLSTVSLNSMHGRKASPTTNLGKSNTTKVCYKPLCGSKMASKPPFIPGQSHGYSLVFHYNAISNRLSYFVAFIHPGLGTSTSQEAKEYFSDMQRHRIPFKYAGPEDDEAITLVRSYHPFGSFLSQCDLHQFNLKFLKIVYAISEFLTML